MNKIKNFIQKQRETSDTFYRETGMPLNRFTLMTSLKELPDVPREPKSIRRRLSDNKLPLTLGILVGIGGAAITYFTGKDYIPLGKIMVPAINGTLGAMVGSWLGMILD